MCPKMELMPSLPRLRKDFLRPALVRLTQPELAGRYGGSLRMEASCGIGNLGIQAPALNSA